MPFTPYHFGPSGFAGLLFRRWLDVPVFVLANVLVDVEVMVDQYLQPGWPVHQIWHFHTLLMGAVAGAVFGAAIYYLKPLRCVSKKSTDIIGLEERATLFSMVLAGILGVWLHVLIDSVYHYDVQIFWPYRKNLVFQGVTQGLGYNPGTVQQWVQEGCVVFWVLMVVLYGILRILKARIANQSRSKSN
ncbi:MAG: metal-dependent hydrolase [Planctomycetales bacterium]|nr:metal-dependent hydrolase [Planctomycetales bacterium]